MAVGTLSMTIKKDEFVPHNIGHYTLLQPMTSNKSGFSKWGFCRKDDKDYFIKEFLNPVYPLDSIDISKEIRNKKIMQCEEWLAQKARIYKRIRRAQTGNLVPPVELFRSGSHYYLVTEKVDEISVDCKAISYFDMEHKMILMKVLANSFSKLAENNVVHADVKLDNLLLKKTKSGYYTIKIIDFDASFIADDPPSGDEMQCDFVYLAPETFLAMIDEPSDLTPKIDVFAMGIVFHQILSGEMPKFDDEYDYVYEAVLNDAELYINKNIPPKFKVLISYMLKKLPSERPSMNDVLTAIKALEDESLYAKKTAPKRPSALKVADDFD